MILCSFGFSKDLFEKKLSWLEQDSKRSLVFVGDKLPNIIHPQVKLYPYKSPLQLFPIAAQIAESALFLDIEVLNTSKSCLFTQFQTHLLEQKRIKTLLLSDAADFGRQAYKNAKVNLSRPYLRIEELKGVFKDIPAVIVGAGPSLEDHADHFTDLSKKALVFAGGHALEKIPSKPHFGAILDKIKPSYIPKTKDIPLFSSLRGYPIEWKGERILVPESHLSFLNTLSNSPSFESGWTVGNMMAQIALFLGCNPIISVGIDYCFKEGKKYAYDLYEPEESQADWAAAIWWMQDLAKKNPETKFCKTSGGKEYLPEFDLNSLQTISIPKLPKTPKQNPLSFSCWEESLKNKDAIVKEELLDPLWSLWKPVFEREFGSHQMEIHKELFFDQVVQEYLQ